MLFLRFSLVYTILVEVVVLAYPTDAAAKLNPPILREAAAFPAAVLSIFPICCLLLFYYPAGSTVSVRRLSKSNAAAFEGYYYFYYSLTFGCCEELKKLSNGSP